MAKYDQEEQSKEYNGRQTVANLEKKEVNSTKQLSLKTGNDFSPAVLEEFKNDYMPVKNSLDAVNDDDIFCDENVMDEIEKDITKNNEKKKKINTLSESLFGYSEDVPIQADVFKKPVLNENKINIIQDVIIEPKRKGKPQGGFDKENETDAFSDADIIEATPPKKEPEIQLLSSQVPKRSLQLDENFIIPPPPGFDEDESSTTPDKLTQERETLNKQLAMQTSTPRSTQIETVRLTTAISPIQPKQQQPLSATPLTVIELTPKRKTFVTTPKQQKSILSYMRSSQQSKTESPTMKSTPCVTCSRLSREQTIAVSGLANKKLASYSNTFGPSVTHVVVNVNEKNRVRDHTMKYVSGVAAGIWVLSFRWVEECLRQNRVVPEVR